MIRVIIEADAAAVECLAVARYLFCTSASDREALVDNGIFTKSSVDAFSECVCLLEEKALPDIISGKLCKQGSMLFDIDEARVVSSMLESIWRLRATQLNIALEPIYVNITASPDVRNEILVIERELKSSFGLRGNSAFGSNDPIFLQIHNNCLYMSDCIGHKLRKHLETKMDFVYTRKKDAYAPVWRGSGEAPKFNILIEERDQG